jgi:hypothetical protein
MSKSEKMGRTTIEELQMKSYEHDPSASAVILEEQSYISFSPAKKKPLIRHYYVRMKILKPTAFDYAIVEIPYYKKVNVRDVKGITYNLDDNGEIETTELNRKSIFKTKYDRDIRIKSFALPNVKEGSVIEYRFEIKTRNIAVFDWEIQSDIPKIKTGFEASVPTILTFNLKGFLKPDLQERSFKDCGNDSCRYLKYEFNHVPAFTEEPFSTGRINYIGSLTFEQNSVGGLIIANAGKRWRMMDRTFVSLDKDLRNYYSFFRSQFQDSVINRPESLQKAKIVYNHIQDYYKLGDQDLKESDHFFKEKTASSFTINTALYTSLKALEFSKVNLVALSTRDHGVIQKKNLGIKDFNYFLVRLTVDDTDYFLDATSKYQPFGTIPFQCLNNEAYIFATEEGSVFKEIYGVENNTIKTVISLSMDDQANFTGDKKITHFGYPALIKREIIDELKETKYIETLESNDFLLEKSNFKIENIHNIDEPLVESYDIEFKTDSKVSYLEIGQLLDLPEKNPLTSDQRLSPVDFGYLRKYNYLLNIKIPQGYDFVDLPEDIRYDLPENHAFLLLKVTQVDNDLSIYLRMQMNKTRFSTEEYHSLKELYDQAVRVGKTLLKIERTK